MNRWLRPHTQASYIYSCHSHITYYIILHITHITQHITQATAGNLSHIAIMWQTAMAIQSRPALLFQCYFTITITTIEGKQKRQNRVNLKAIYSGLLKQCTLSLNAYQAGQRSIPS